MTWAAELKVDLVQVEVGGWSELVLAISTGRGRFCGWHAGDAGSRNFD